MPPIDIFTTQYNILTKFVSTVIDHKAIAVVALTMARQGLVSTIFLRSNHLGESGDETQ